MLLAVTRKWWVLLLRGICMVIVGLLAIAWPEITLLTLVILYGIHALIDGIGSIALGFSGEAKGAAWWEMILVGVLGIGAGIIALVWPGLTLFVLLVIIASWAIARGVFEIIAAIRLRKVIDDEWALILGGVLSIAFGLLILLRPDAGALAIALLIGSFMMVQGFFAILLALRLRGVYHRLKSGLPPAQAA
jgi:uncharacterized membrane protein HdeD (DUF308 family)